MIQIAAELIVLDIHELNCLVPLLANHERPLDECGSRGGGAKTLHRA